MQDQQTSRKASQTTQLPPIPDKIYFTIGEVSQLCDLKPHVLRYWEQEFPQLSPSKRRGNRRYYQRSDVITVREIRSLLYEQGYTIEGARLQLSKDNKNKSVSGQRVVQSVQKAIADLEKLLEELEN